MHPEVCNPRRIQNRPLNFAECFSAKALSEVQHQWILSFDAFQTVKEHGHYRPIQLSQQLDYIFARKFNGKLFFYRK